MLLRLIRETPPATKTKRYSIRSERESEHEHFRYDFRLKSVRVDEKLVEADERYVCLFYAIILCAVRAGLDCHNYYA